LAEFALPPNFVRAKALFPYSLHSPDLMVGVTKWFSTP